MSSDSTHKIVTAILNATKIKFDGNDFEWQEALYFDFDGTHLWVMFNNLADILSSDTYPEVRAAFIAKLANPIEFMNNEIVKCLKLPKELKLKVAMQIFCEES